jgi:hypothetical protein
MRLKDPVKTVGSFAVALRAIGQDLEPLLPQTFDIRFEQEAFMVHGVALRSAPNATEHKATRFERRYTAEEIYRLDRAARQRQTGHSKKPDAASLPEAMRTVGRAVDAKSGRLVRIVKEERRFAFEYVDAAGAQQREESYSLTAYQEQQKAIAERSGRDVWDERKD